MPTMQSEYSIIDVFTSEPGGGNAAAVVLDADGLDDVRMQAIAADFNLSETTFVLPASTERRQASTGGGPAAARLRFRWFTPTIEVSMCGHATIAGVYSLAEAGRLSLSDGGSATVEIETRSGLLTAFVEPLPGGTTWMIWLDLIDPTLVHQLLPEEELTRSLGLEPETLDRSFPPVRSQDGDVLLFVRDVESLNGAAPDFAVLGDLLERLDVRGLALATVNTLAPSIHLQSRFFAPTAGVNEDPVTGSVHGPLAAYFVQRGHVPLHDGLAALTCIQGIPGGRTGLIHALVQPQAGGVTAVRIGGRAVTTRSGTLQL